MQAAAGQYKDLIMQSTYWQRVSHAVAVATPILKLMRLSDGDVPSIGKVHYYAAKVSLSICLKCVLCSTAST
jgi:hypothetical protein